ncbi:MAG: hypothetical protein ACRD2J_11455 [Thermoanaerobaculia bacterium]
MSYTRREFLVTSGAALSMAAVVPTALEGSVSDEGRVVMSTEPAWIAGDPYTASACAGGLGGRSFDAARENALRFRMPADERDRILLGLEGI